MNNKVSIIIPAFNEERRILKSLAMIGAHCKKRKYNYEILVVNDGSTDKTKNVVENFPDENIFLLEYGRNHGKGYAVKHGVMAAKGSLILFSDADLSVPIETMDEFIKLSDNADIVFGSRKLPKSDIKIRQPKYRELGGKMINRLMRVVLRIKTKDTQCGFKLFKKNCAKDLFQRQTIDGFGFDMEILFIAKQLGYKMIEAPVIWRNDSHTKVRPVQDGLKIILDMFKIRANHPKGKY